MNIMNYILDILIPKTSIDFLELVESKIELGGILYSQYPAVFLYKSELIFEEYIDKKYYRSFLENDFKIDDFIALHLKSSQLSELEFSVNNKDINYKKNRVVEFLLTILDLKQFAILLIYDEENIDKKYITKNKEELVDIIYQTLNWDVQCGVLITNI